MPSSSANFKPLPASSAPKALASAGGLRPILLADSLQDCGRPARSRSVCKVAVGAAFAIKAHYGARAISREIGEFPFQSWWIVVIYRELFGGCVYASPVSIVRRDGIGIDARQGSV